MPNRKWLREQTLAQLKSCQNFEYPRDEGIEILCAFLIAIHCGDIVDAFTKLDLEYETKAKVKLIE